MSCAVSEATFQSLTAPLTSPAASVEPSAENRTEITLAV